MADHHDRSCVCPLFYSKSRCSTSKDLPTPYSPQAVAFAAAGQLLYLLHPTAQKTVPSF